MKKNQKRRNAFIAVIVSAIFTTTSSNAAITVLKLTDGVGDINSSTAGLVVSGAPAIGANDDNWGFDTTNDQASLGTGDTANLSGYVWGSRVDLGENAPAVDTVVSGLSSEVSYNVYGYYVVHSASTFDWGIQLALNGASFSSYDKTSGVSEQVSGNLDLRRVLLGQVSGITTVTVNIDDYTGSGNPRSFIKGIGVEAIPEPGVSLIAALSLVMMSIIRKRE